MKKHPTFVPIIFGLLILAATSAAAALTPAKVHFTAPIDSPAAIQFCSGSLWTYSAKHKNLTRLNPETGLSEGTTSLASLGADGHVLSIGCNGKSLLLALQKRKGSERSFSLIQAPLSADGTKVSRGKSLPLPGTGLIRDIFCRSSSNYCFLIRDKIYKTSDLQRWSDTKIPLSKDITSIEGNLEENPFAHWYDSFIVANGQYFKGGFLEDRFFLLDPLRVSVATFSLRDEKPEGKWGKWGVWAGKMMSPKGIVPIGKDHFAISDVGLKLVFLFNNKGEYKGSVGADAGSARFGYPLALTSKGNTLYVADFGGSKVTAIDLNPEALQASLPAPVPGTSKKEKIETFLRPNFFRDPEVLKARARTRCLTCHDGLQINSLDKFMEQGKHHPINITMKAVKIDLPLENGTMVTCSSCHDAHHGMAEGPLNTKAQKQPYMLRKPVKKLCTTCHASKGNPETNHMVMNPEEACADCHTIHVSQDYLLKEKIPNLCTDCHGKEKIPTAHPFSPDMVTCVSCHSLHDSSAKMSFATHSQFATTGKGEASATCLMCHEDKKGLIGKNYHLGTESQNPHPWPKDEAMCLDCHNPHAKAKPQIKQICAQCHGEMKGSHPVSIPIADTAVGKGVILDQGKVNCMTCHDPHGASPLTDKGRHFFRPAEKLLEFCAGCHGDRAADVYRNFHNRGKK